MSDPFARALRDHHDGEQSEPLYYRNGEQTREAPLQPYFDRYEGENDFLESWLDGPLLDMGAGVGRHALYFQKHFETVAIEAHEALVETMRHRGVDDARRADMFALRDAFDRDRFRSALAVGTQVGLCGSTTGLREFLGDLAYVTGPDATAVIDGFDPEQEATRTMPGYEADAADGVAFRVIQFEYDGVLGDPWLYRLFAPRRIREAAVGTGWTVADVENGDGDWAHRYHVALRKR